MSIFEDQRIENIYEEIIDEKINEYNENLEEISFLQERFEEYPEVFQGMFEYVKKINILDTKETSLFKLAKEKNIPTVFLTKDGDFFFNLSVEDFENLEDLKNIWKNLNLLPDVSLKDYIEFIIYNTDDQELIEEIIKIYKDIDINDYEDDYWEKKLDNYMKKDKEILDKIYIRQLQLLTNTIHPDIKKSKYKIKSRTISFDVLESDTSITNSIYDKFIFKDPDEDIPFIKLYNMNENDIYKVYTQVNNTDIIEWIKIEENIEKETYFENYEPYIFFLIKWKENNSIKPVYSECFLSSNKIIVKIPYNVQIDSIQDILSNKLKDFFEIEIENIKEVSVEIEAILSNFEYIDLTIFQYYLLNDENSPIYINEKKMISTVSSDTRKIKFNYNSFIERIEEYVIKYEKSDAYRFNISGPEESLTLKFFKEIFGRYIHGFLLRQHALKVTIHRLIVSPETLISTIKEDKSKKKKPTFLPDPYTVTYKKKIDYIKSLVKIPNSYSRFSQCKNQPIILEEEEAKAWLNVEKTVFSGKNKDSKKEIKAFTNSKGHKLYFACPTESLPIIHFIKEEDTKNSFYRFYPRCLSKKISYNESINIVEGEDDDKDIAKDINTVKSFNINNIDEDEIPNPSINRRSYLDIELKHILSHLIETNYKNIKLIYPYSKTTKYMVLSILKYLFLNKNTSIEDLRNDIADKTNPMLVTQEALGKDILPEDLVENFRNPDTLVNTDIHIRMLEEYFGIHIFVFTMHSTIDKKNKQIVNKDINMEIPSNKLFHIRSLKKNRKCIILLKNLETQDYALISNGRNENIFQPEVTVRLMEMFYEMSKYTISKNNNIYTNFYSKYYWQDFIPNDPIIAQEIDIVGKCRIIQSESGLTIQIPPTDPFNVPLIEKYTKYEYKDIENLFGKPNGKDEKCVYYSYHGIPNMISILCKNITWESENIIDIPMSIFQSTERVDLEISLYKQLQRATYALIQLIQWGWFISSRPNFKQWFDNIVSIVSKPDNPYDILPLQIFTYLPKVEDPIEGFKIINRWWPELFLSNGKIKIWNELYDKIIIFFENEERVIGNYIRDKEVTMPNLLGFYNEPEDYPTPEGVKVLQSSDDFIKWYRMDKFKEENPTIEVIDIIDFKDIKDILEKKNYFRIKVKNHYFVVKNFENNDKESVIKQALDTLELTEKDDFGINIYAFSKKYDIVLKEGTFEKNHVDILMYPNDTYALIQFE